MNMATVHDVGRTRPNVERVGRIEEIRRYVRLTMSCVMPVRPDHERRQEHRYPFPYAMLVKPADEHCHVIGEEPISIIGHHLSEQGFDFFSKEAIPHRYLIVSFPIGENQTAELLLNLNWCRFGHLGWYENGGKFEQAVPTSPPARTPW